MYLMFVQIDMLTDSSQKRWLLVAAVILQVVVTREELGQSPTEEEAKRFMKSLNKKFSRQMNRVSKAQWNYETNLTDYNQHKVVELTERKAELKKKWWKQVISYNWKCFGDPSLRRQFKILSVIGKAALNEDKGEKLTQVVSNMQRIFGTTKLPARPRDSKIENRTIDIEQLEDIFSSQQSTPEQLQYYWQGWHDAIGTAVKPLFQEYVGLSNEAARSNGFSDMAAFWMNDYEMDDFEKQIHALMVQIQPLFKQLHAYVRRELSKVHNKGHRITITRNGPLPAHLLGNVWAQVWTNVYNKTVPYPDKPSIDVTPTMKSQNYTPLKMFKLSEEFYTSLNMSKMTKTFWKKSMIKRPPDRKVICHASAWDFFDGKDFRIKMCTKTTMPDLMTVHHEMGHIQYYQHYKNQPVVFRDGANPGFHEAIGDVIALSVSSPKHLIKIGLLDHKTYNSDKQTDINSLYHMALEKVAFLPFAFVLDHWRWDVFRGKVSPEKYNSHFWKLRQEFQGVTPPVCRREKGVDAGAKYHIVADISYMSYFVSYVIVFQFHKALCIKAGQYDPNSPDSRPLHQCDIYQSTAAGNAFAQMLQMGSSKPWQDAMEVLTGQRNMDAGPLLEYFKPLLEWLVEENSKHDDIIGWRSNSKYVCTN